MHQFQYRAPIYSLVLCACMLSACNLIRSAPDAARPRPIAQSDPNYLVDTKQLSAYGSAPPDSDAQKALRNDIIDERIFEIDTQFERFTVLLWRSDTEYSIYTDWALLALSGATATVGGVATKAALGASSTGIAGAKASFDKDAYINKTLPALIAQMNADREKLRAGIIASERLPTSQYSLYAGLSDLRKFIRAGTLPGAIQGIGEAAGVKANAASDAILTQYKDDDAGHQLFAYWKPNGSVNNVHASKIRAWMKSHGLPTGPGTLVHFIFDAQFADKRREAANDLIPH